MSNVPSPRIVRMWNQSVFTHERRSATRYAPTDERLWMGWWASTTEFRVVGACFRDISRTGAAVIVDDTAFADAAVWLRLETEGDCLSVKGRVVSIQQDEATDSFLVRIRFQSPCPSSFLDAVASGLSSTPSESVDQID